MKKSTPKPLPPLPPEAFPITVPGSDITVLPVGDLGSLDYGIRIDWPTYGRNAAHWMLPPGGDFLPWQQHMVFARPHNGPGSLTENQVATIWRLANASTIREIVAGSQVRPDSARQYLTSIYRALGVGNGCTAVTALFLAGAKPPEAAAPLRPLEETEVQIFTLFAGGYTQETLARRFNTSPAGISRRIDRLCEALGLDGPGYAPAACARMFRLGVFIVGRQLAPLIPVTRSLNLF